LKFIDGPKTDKIFVFTSSEVVTIGR